MEFLTVEQYRLTCERALNNAKMYRALNKPQQVAASLEHARYFRIKLAAAKHCAFIHVLTKAEIESGECWNCGFNFIFKNDSLHHVCVER